MADQGNPKGNPEKVAKEMLSKTYDQLEVKDMSREAFVNECYAELCNKKNNKSPLILPGQ